MKSNFFKKKLEEKLTTAVSKVINVTFDIYFEQKKILLNGNVDPYDVEKERYYVKVKNKLKEKGDI